MKKIRVLVVDDSEFLRRTLPRLLESDPEIEVVATAATGAEALTKVRELRPDVVTLDVMMPDMDGLTALKHIMRDMPTPVVMVSMTTYEDAWETLEALALGAVDFITKPSGPTSLDIASRRAELVEKVHMAHAARDKVIGRMDTALTRLREVREDLARSNSETLAPLGQSGTGPLGKPWPSTGPLGRTTGDVEPPSERPKAGTGPLTPIKRDSGPLTLPETPVTGSSGLGSKSTGLLGRLPAAAPMLGEDGRPISGPERELPPGGKRLVAIAASTGGPAALQELLPRLPATLDAGVVIVQHIAVGFTRPLAERLHSLSGLEVVEAQDGAPIVPGIVLVAPAGLHLRVARQGKNLVAQISPEPTQARHKPAADVLFRSIALCCAAEACAVLLTGMGDDGALGLRAIREAGGWTVAQDEATSVVWGMPRRAVELGAVRALLALEDIAAEIVRATRK